MVDNSDDDEFSIDKRDIGDVPTVREIEGEDMDSVMKDLTSKVSSMSVKDREAGLFDLHGITGIDDKSIEEERLSVTQMRQVITERLNWWAAEAFVMAQNQNPEFTRDEKLLLMFLRCENYNIGPAVNRLFAFFKQRLRLFGPEKVGKRMITLDDMNADDMKCYSAGFFQLLPQRDHVGRAQLVSLPQYATWKERKNGLRMIFHLFTTTAMDERTQKNGAVAIVHSVHDDRTNACANDLIFGWDSTQLMQKAVPLRIVGQHVCTNPSPLASRFFSTLSRFLDKTGIARIRFHQGSSDEVEQQLSTFGISNVQTVITHSGEKKTDKHKEYLKTVKAIERALNVTPEKLVVLVPSSTDILLGRGKPIQNHPGNVRLGLIVESQLIANAEKASRQEKTKLAEVTMIKMQRAGMRFLTKENGYWEEVTSERIRRERVSSAFRTVRDRLKFSQRNINVASSVRKRSQVNIGETASFNKKLNQTVTLQHCCGRYLYPDRNIKKPYVKTRKEYIGLSGKLAREAVDAQNRGYVFGSLGPLVESYRADMIKAHEEGVQDYMIACDALLPFVDAYLLETASCVEESTQVMDAMLSSNSLHDMPLLVSFTLNNDGNTRDNKDILSGMREILKESKEKKIELLGIMFNCCKPEAVSRALEKIRADNDLVALLEESGVVLGVYANRLTDIDPNWTLAESEEAQPFRMDLDEKHYWEFIKMWTAEYGVKVVGGCCGISPEHIAHIHRELGKFALQ